MDIQKTINCQTRTEAIETIKTKQVYATSDGREFPSMILAIKAELGLDLYSSVTLEEFLSMKEDVNWTSFELDGDLYCAFLPKSEKDVFKILLLVTSVYNLWTKWNCSDEDSTLVGGRGINYWYETLMKEIGNPLYLVLHETGYRYWSYGPLYEVKDVVTGRLADYSVIHEGLDKIIEAQGEYEKKKLLDMLEGKKNNG